MRHSRGADNVVRNSVSQRAIESQDSDRSNSIRNEKCRIALAKADGYEPYGATVPKAFGTGA